MVNSWLLCRQEAARLERTRLDTERIPEEARVAAERWECVRVEARRKELQRQGALAGGQGGRSRRQGRLSGIPNFHREVRQVQPPTRKDSIRPGTASLSR